MQQSDSILDKVISSKQASIINEFNPKNVVDIILEPLTDREREVIVLRHNLDLGGRKTLEKIGNNFNITRERVRQIENSALNKIKNLSDSQNIIEPIEIIFNQTLEHFGGIMSEEMLLEEILSLVGSTEENKTYTSFMLSQLLRDRFHYSQETEKFHPAWKQPSVSWENYEDILNLLIKIIEDFNEPVDLNRILSHLQKNYADHPQQSYFNEPTVISFLKISKKVKPNPFDEWGIAGWDLITLKRISDKVYLVLKKKDEPLHFTKIAQEIDKLKFSNKQANPATIHNELILDDKYVLVGRGIYALKEWGYQPGIVVEVIIDILKNATKPLTREEIIDQVLKKRFVKKSTIILSLMDKNKFIKNPDGTYSLKNV
ncbi:hypothetical protein KKF32_03155 [Patescibacteria group bacterium]|nr:hypothetical protein [Patescibacteria group bacterium]